MIKLAKASRTCIDDSGREFTYSSKDFARVKTKIYDVAGISRSEHKKDLVYNRLVRRLRELEMQTFDQYLHYLDESSDELSSFINAMTTNLTSFYRESHHFEHLTNVFIPELVLKKQRKLRIWSSACSVGEEAYSIAIALAEAKLDFHRWDVKILATDIDTNVLATARAGVYGLERIDSLSIDRKRLAFLRGKGPQAEKVMVKKSLRSLIEFKQCNLMDSWPIPEKLDIIFCRNVMIYFDKETQNRVLDRMTETLNPGGLLCLGHSETPARSMKEYKAIGRTMYQKL